MILVWLILVLAFLSFAFIVAVGAPFVPTKKADLTKLFEHLKLRKGTSLIDLGSGDGRVLLMASKKGLKATGYELNPFLVLLQRIRLSRYRKSKVLFKSYWSSDISKADVIFVFSAQPYMNRLVGKLERELKSGATVVSYAFSFPSRKIDEKFGAFNIYKF
jgi:16S rRNA A1518/A1519 N6-dimethyltransferase RsmA/KsgA/DIM1 with predicted DNA glycosylase/AP lyase activity